MLRRAELANSGLLDGMSDDPEKWKICDRDRFGMGSCFPKVKRCEKCGKNGHNEKRCPLLRNQCFICGSSGHRIYRCPDRYCSICFRRGHSQEDCYRSQARCSVCSCVGHLSEFCSLKWKRFLTVTDMDTYQKHVTCDVKAHDCNVCSFSRWTLMSPIQERPFLPPDTSHMPPLCSVGNTSTIRGPKRKANSNLRPKNATKKQKNSPVQVENVIRQRFIKFEPSSDEDDLDTLVPLNADPSVFSLPQLINESSSYNPSIDHFSSTSTNHSLSQAVEEDSFYDLLQNSTSCNTESLNFFDSDDDDDPVENVTNAPSTSSQNSTFVSKNKKNKNPNQRFPQESSQVGTDTKTISTNKYSVKRRKYLAKKKEKRRLAKEKKPTATAKKNKKGLLNRKFIKQAEMKADKQLRNKVDPVTPEQRAELVAKIKQKQAEKRDRKKAQRDALTPEQRAQINAQKREKRAKQKAKKQAKKNAQNANQKPQTSSFNKTNSKSPGHAQKKAKKDFTKKNSRP